MANTYTQIYIHIVFAVHGRQNLISQNHKEELYRYITGIITKRGQKLIAINGMSDHVHVFVGMTASVALSDLVRDMKAGSSGFINERKWMRGRFNWQEGFGAFSYSHSQIDQVVKYIRNQEEHHRKTTFKEEYLEMLKAFSVIHDEQYLFKWIEDEPAE